ncbi:MAG: MobF family relaxase, partial [Litorimonas sp.]
MMSIAKVGTAAGAARYYTRDNYYTGGEQAAESTWAGAGAARLGLSPNGSDVVDVYRTPQPVEARAFEAVLDGRPSESVQIGHRDRDGTWQHQPGFDLTFLAPKSVSILALVGGDRRLIDAHRAAVAETMAFVEERLIGVQENPKGGPKTMRPTQSGVFALFTHDLSRAHDALLHTHAVVANATWDPLKDRWRAIDGQALYDNRRLISNVFDARLRARTEALGYRTEMSGRYGAWEVPIGDAAIRLQSKRRQAILDRLGKAASTADWNTRQDVARATRDAKRAP